MRIYYSSGVAILVSTLMFGCATVNQKNRAARVEPSANLEPNRVEIHLFDAQERVMPGAPWQLDCGDGMSSHGVAMDGWVRITVNRSPPECTLQWGKDKDDSDYLYSLKLFIGCSEVTDTQERWKRMLNNMGYDVSTSLDAAVRAFQQDSLRTVTGLVNNAIPAATGRAIEQKYRTITAD